VSELDPAIDTGKISAKMEQGMLTLALPKSERVKPRKITVSDLAADYFRTNPAAGWPRDFLLGMQLAELTH
jgi:hypothetical protein